MAQRHYGPPEDDGVRRSPVALWRVMRRIQGYSRPYVPRLLTGLVFTALAMVSWLVIPLGLRELLDAVFEEGDRALLNLLSLGMLVLFALVAIFWYGGNEVLAGRL